MEHITDLGELFERVQLESVFPDGKTFVDCIPCSTISDIRNRYDDRKNQPDFDLPAFIHENFRLPELPAAKYRSDAGRSITQHLEMLWPELSRVADETGSSLINLPNPYVVPGGRFREMFYWDSYFTMLGLAESGKVDMIEGMIDNFSFMIDKLGYIPNGNRSYFIGRSQPPFYASMVQLLADVKGDEAAVLIKYLPYLQQEYDFWMRGMDNLQGDNTAVNRVVLMADGSILNRYWDESDLPRPESFKEDIELSKNVQDKGPLFRNIRAACESGWDFSSRWFREDGLFTSIHTTEIIPVDLNCLLYNLELTIAQAYTVADNSRAAEKFSALAAKRKHAINLYCWNDSEEFYFDYDFVSSQSKQEWTLAGSYPLFFKVATDDMAAYVQRNLKKHFLFPGGLRTTTKVSLQQWDSPNGWAPLQWIVVRGLMNYGFTEEAREISVRWTMLNEKVYNNTGKMMEKYNVVSTDLAAGGGEYQSQDGFGWTNGVYLALKKIL